MHSWYLRITHRCAFKNHVIITRKDGRLYTLRRQVGTMYNDVFTSCEENSVLTNVRLLQECQIQVLFGVLGIHVDLKEEKPLGSWDC